MKKSIALTVMCCVLFCFSTIAKSAVVIDLKIGHAPVRRAVGKVVVKQAVRAVKVRRAVRRLIVRRIVINRLHNLVH